MGCLETAALAFLVAASVASAPAVAQQRPAKITVGYGIGTDFTIVFIDEDKGIFAKHGLDVTLVAVPNPALAPAALVAGNMQIALNTAPNLLLGNEGGLDLVALAGIGRLTKANPEGALVTRPGFHFTRADDLRGKRVGVPGYNSAVDLVLRTYLLDNHVPLGSVAIVEVPFNQMGDMLREGQIDAAIPLEPMLSRIVASGAGVRALDIQAEVNPDILAGIWTSTRAWAESNRATVAAFRASLEDGLAWWRQNPAEARAIESKWIGYATDKDPTIALDLDPKGFEFWIGVCRRLGLLRQPVDPASLIFR